MHFKYFKLLIQEFAVKIDHGLIYSLLAFLKQEKVSRTFVFVGWKSEEWIFLQVATAPTINMDTDLEQIRKALAEIIKNQIESPTGETEMYFDNIHLSPLKVCLRLFPRSLRIVFVSDSRQFLDARIETERRTVSRISVGRISSSDVKCRGSSRCCSAVNRVGQ